MAPRRRVAVVAEAADAPAADAPMEQEATETMALTMEQVEATETYKLLMQFSSPKGITCEIDNSMWPGVTDLPPQVKGKIEQWVNRSALRLKILWTEADGSEAYDVDMLPHLLEHNFKLLKGPRGERLLLRGAAAREAQAAQPKTVIEVPYMDGAIEKVQKWIVEPNPEAIDVDARKEERFRATLNRNQADVDTPYKMWRNAMLVKT